MYCNSKGSRRPISSRPPLWHIRVSSSLVYVSVVSSNPPSAYSYKFAGTFSLCVNRLAESAREWDSNTRWKIDEQWDCWTLGAIKIEAKNRGEEGTTPVTTACPEAGKYMCEKKKKNPQWGHTPRNTRDRSIISHTACKDGFRRSLQSHSWIIFHFYNTYTRKKIWT